MEYWSRKSLTTIVFSKNRACQLELLLRSLNIPVTVLYTYDPEFEAGYDKLIPMYPSVKFIKESNFRKELLNLIKKASEYIMFLVDDDIMIRPFDENSKEFEEFKRDSDILSLSLRMSPDYRWRGLPEFTNNKWKWKPYSRSGEKFRYRLRIWGYPMAVGGNMFRKEDLLYVLSFTKEIKSPNYLEVAMQINTPDRSLMKCFDKAKFVNNEINQVQKDFPSHTPGPTAIDLEKRFVKGERLSLSDIIEKTASARDYFIKTDYKWEKYK